MERCIFLELLEHFLDDFFDSKKVDYQIYCVENTLTFAVFFNTNVYIIKCDNCFDYAPRNLAVLLYKGFLKNTLKDIYGDCKYISNFIE